MAGSGGKEVPGAGPAGGPQHVEALLPFGLEYLLLCLAVSAVVCVFYVRIQRCQRRLGSLLDRATGFRLFEIAPTAADHDGSLKPPPARAQKPLVFIGTGQQLIHTFEYDEDLGTLAPFGEPTPAGGSPTWLAPFGSLLFAADESGAGGGCAALAIYGSPPLPLRLINAQPDPLTPSGPCHCVPDRTGRWLLASNYAHGSICVYPVGADGSLGACADCREFGGGGGSAPSHAHCGVFSADNRHAWVCDLGLDLLHQFEFDSGTRGKSRALQKDSHPFGTLLRTLLAAL
eukprot:SAG22_NODE_95_length_20791_cov_40.318514_16_plen_288_part_00